MGFILVKDDVGSVKYGAKERSKFPRPICRSRAMAALTLSIPLMVSIVPSENRALLRYGPT